jgi:hypothetical protein
MRTAANRMCVLLEDRAHAQLIQVLRATVGAPSARLRAGHRRMGHGAL